MIWLGILGFLDVRVPGGKEAVFEASLPEVRLFISQLFVAAGWYDLMPILTVSDTVSALLKLDKSDYVRESAIWQAQRDMNGVYKSLLKFPSPAAVVRRFAAVYGQAYNFGSLRITHEAERLIELEVRGMPEVLASWWMKASGCYIEPVLRAAGAKNNRVTWAKPERDGSQAGVPLVRLCAQRIWD